MYYNSYKKRRKRRIVSFFSVILLLSVLTYGYFSKNNKKADEIPYISKGEENKSIEKIKNIEKTDKNDKNDGGVEIVSEKILEDNLTNEENQDDLRKKELVNKDTEIIFNILYKKTGEIVKDKVKVPITLVGMTLREFQDYIEKNYSDWKIKNISTNFVTLFKEKDGYIPNYYLIQNKDGYITIYKINEFGEKVLYQKTEIPLSVLSEVDKHKLEKGILVKSLDEVMSIIEDYSS
ncbi:BofC C-terminal domain-containing protein [Caminicella sporogenes DSM 14501]|uniref:BofC C-terminal domain-containing protein n=1 Tax=Caminicella sporogenes DSM 14501 TaxID=1121266 RepID=A0A1M6M261_9FIRM|nr:BofC C-terminal domain-containing protein [Caminicella sporogenes]RKD28036.1 hypothetical protein BET04_02970 [Caminicella sporogenes]SHJ77528.1 BofC C-terminal domain-containing protein [Caminicella sporogenes DSM 14501]